MLFASCFFIDSFQWIIRLRTRRRLQPQRFVSLTLCTAYRASKRIWYYEEVISFFTVTYFTLQLDFFQYWMTLDEFASREGKIFSFNLIRCFSERLERVVCLLRKGLPALMYGRNYIRVDSCEKILVGLTQVFAPSRSIRFWFLAFLDQRLERWHTRDSLLI